MMYVVLCTGRKLSIQVGPIGRTRAMSFVLLPSIGVCAVGCYITLYTLLHVDIRSPLSHYSKILNLHCLSWRPHSGLMIHMLGQMATFLKTEHVPLTSPFRSIDIHLGLYLALLIYLLLNPPRSFAPNRFTPGTPPQNVHPLLPFSLTRHPCPAGTGTGTQTAILIRSRGSKPGLTTLTIQKMMNL